ncbi:helix-turn-helix domain-containing protein [Rhodococcus aetherivorans]|uniref:helix-turn-helix domain-containing protein n=1 Tax=Rhodococcus aetherivorans TaxID=191292 RepID=UPI001C8C0444|nr:helix-turn-helix domain-containing protein [Rhodococcus aetherivorans]
MMAHGRTSTPGLAAAAKGDEAKTSVVLVVPASVAGHLDAALFRHRKWMRGVGMPIPAELHDLAEALALLANQRQSAPNFRHDRPIDDGRGMDPIAVPYTEAARLLSVSERSISRLVADGTLAPVAIGGAKRIPIDQLHRLVTGGDE